ncbi:MAG: 4Fe-4S ferredoxin [Pleurocapsa sp. SU_196_0]|nr:4Fe-4S ferredoxin [Pleurocapsa sp. SU_196_0]
MTRAAPRFDLLRLPGLRGFLRWRYARFALQVPLFLVALLAVYDGFTGRQIAPVNTATVSVWVHYRGLVALAIAVAGNLFCAACPLMLTRGPTRFLKRFVPEFQFPRVLRNKYTVLAMTAFFLFSYEHFDLWASPWLTAWLVIAYFAAALLFDTFFPAGTFCKYVCPLGNFNFALSQSAPTQITAVNSSICQSCEGKYCLNGREETATTRQPLSGHRGEHVRLEVGGSGFGNRESGIETSGFLLKADRPARGVFPGCETDLFVPTMQSNQDCTLCLNCVRACPYDNVALEVRSPLREAETVRPRADWAWFVVVLTWAGLMNAFAMIPPYFAVAAWLSGVLGTRDEALLLLVIQVVGIGAGVALTLGAARLSARGQTASPLRDWIGVLLPLALAAWGGHYLFHFVTGYETLLPNAVTALNRLGLNLPAIPLPAATRGDGIFLYQVVISYAALFGSLWVAYRKAARGLVLRLVPQVLLALMFNTLTLLIFSQPMQARGSLLP